ncbi:hypothetical protein HPB47_003286 [Ixodes persulcatus]|uniref:Uncharacterized protein n=1 Tax=Ixodes persulcatus TaxID=34615 RepID=A0AC60PIX4_IXOPE|nr:hypothetical protein HPB47_003286 [Ixodes persulcatus]
MSSGKTCKRFEEIQGNLHFKDNTSIPIENLDALAKLRPFLAEVSRTRNVKHDEFTLNAIRLKVHRNYSEREIPTLDSILEAVNEDNELPDLSKTTLRGC